MDTIITNEERHFFHAYAVRHGLDEVIALQSLVYWYRIKNSLQFIHDKEVYMILCLHLATKFLSEEYKISFSTELKNIIGKDYNYSKHVELEYLVFSSLLDFVL